MSRFSSPLLSKNAADDPSDPEIHVVGYAMMKVSTAKAKIADYINQYKALTDSGKWYELGVLDRNGVLRAHIQAVSKFEEENKQ